MKRLMVTAILKLSRKTGLFSKRLLDRYGFMHDPLQIKFLIESYESIKSVSGSYVEIGCAYGSTTVLMKKLDEVLGTQRKFFALDTFSGFVAQHAEHDISVLGRDPSLKRGFQNNSKDWILEVLRFHGMEDVQVIEGDATEKNYDDMAPIAFCLIDVDLYKPITKLLPIVVEKLAPGGIIIVDDCRPDDRWEGALVAYNEYMAGVGRSPEIAAGKYGIVRQQSKA